MSRQITPLIRPLRTESGTLYVFPSATEDIGLNLNTRDNRVSLSKYALLNLPVTNSRATDATTSNYFNFPCIPSVGSLISSRTYNTDSIGYQCSDKVAIAIQDYMMNFETTLVNEDSYNYSANKTVSERVFWKFLKETGAIRWKRTDYKFGSATVYEEADEKDASGNATGYSRVVQQIGQISAGNSLSNSMGMFNETYVNIPTSYGAGRVFFTVDEDENYKLGHKYKVTDNPDYLAGRDSSTSNSGYTVNKPAYDSFYSTDSITAYNDSSLPWYSIYDTGTTTDTYTYFTESEPDASADMDNLINVFGDGSALMSFRRSNLDGVEAMTDIDDIEMVFNQIDSSHGLISYDTINTDTDLEYKADFEFNAVLLYYSIYDKDSGLELATNLFGILFLNGPVTDSTDTAGNTGSAVNFYIPTFTKRQSSGEGSGKTYGTGYSFRINVKSLSVYDNTDAYIYDNTTTDAIVADDFNEVLSSLNKTVTLLNRNSVIMDSVYGDYATMKNTIDSLQYNVTSLSQKISSLMSSRLTTIDASTISTTDLNVTGSMSLSGTLTLPDSYAMGVPVVDSSEIYTSGLQSRTADVSALRCSDAEITSCDTSVLVAHTVSITGGVAEKLKVDNLYQDVETSGGTEVIETTENDLMDGVYANLADNINVLKNADGELMVDPVSFDSSALNDVSYLYNASDNIPKVNYTKIVPLLLLRVQALEKYIRDSSI